jgi:hypothetical protein
VSRRTWPGFNVERPQAEPRMNDLDAGEERRRLSQEGRGRLLEAGFARH